MQNNQKIMSVVSRGINYPLIFVFMRTIKLLTNVEKFSTII